MSNKDTITCAVTGAAGCAMGQAASVFRSVNSSRFSSRGCCNDWDNWDNNTRSNSCCNECDNCNDCGNARKTGDNGRNTATGTCPRCGNNPCTCGCGNARKTTENWQNTATGTCPRCGNNPCTCGCGNARKNAENWQNTATGTCPRCGNNPCTCGCGNARKTTENWQNTAAGTCPRCGNNPCTCGCGNARKTAENWQNTAAGTCPRCGNNPCTCNRGKTPAMVYETDHALQLHAAEEAIRKGTLFSDLYMPMHGECADNCGAQLCDGQAEAFAAWELRLYLNTHPCDRHALEMFKRYARCADQPNYAGAFAFDDSCPDRWSWTDAPWPWEFNAACENNCGC